MKSDKIREGTIIRSKYSQQKICVKVDRTRRSKTPVAGSNLRSQQSLSGSWLAESTLGHVVRVGRHWSIPPQPAHHLRHDGAAELLPVLIHAPGVVPVVTFLCESFHQSYIL